MVTKSPEAATKPEAHATNQQGFQIPETASATLKQELAIIFSPDLHGHAGHYLLNPDYHHFLDHLLAQTANGDQADEHYWQDIKNIWVCP